MQRQGNLRLTGLLNIQLASNFETFSIPRKKCLFLPLLPLLDLVLQLRLPEGVGGGLPESLGTLLEGLQVHLGGAADLGGVVWNREKENVV